MKVDNIEALEAYFDGEMSPEEANIFEKRLQAEPDLREELESFKRCSTALSQFPKVKVPFDLTDSILERAATAPPLPFAFADSSDEASRLTESVMTSSNFDESAQPVISRESDKGYVDDWQPPTIMQRISRAMLWPTMVLIIALGLYLSKPNDTSVPIKTNPDESEISQVEQNNVSNENLPDASAPFFNPPADVEGRPMEEVAIQESVQGAAVSEPADITVLQANDVPSNEVDSFITAAPDEVQFEISCRIDLTAFKADQWNSTLKELGVSVDETKAPLEVGSWTFSTTASQRAEALAMLNSVPGVVFVQVTPTNAKRSDAAEEGVSQNAVLTKILIQTEDNR